MHRALIILPVLLLLCSFHFAPEPEVQTESKDLHWSASRPLRWDDFTLRTGQAGVFKAMTTSGMSYKAFGENGLVEIRCHAYFIPSESWVHTDHRNAELLRHEQGHFDLSAVFAARLEAALAVYEVTASEFLARDLNRVVEAEFDRYYADLDAMQDAYDLATRHGSLKEAQEEWSRKIAEMLREAGCLDGGNATR